MMENNFSNESNEDETLPAGQLVILSSPSHFFARSFPPPPIIFDQMIKDHQQELQAVFPDVIKTEIERRVTRARKFLELCVFL